MAAWHAWMPAGCRGMFSIDEDAILPTLPARQETRFSADQSLHRDSPSYCAQYGHLWQALESMPRHERERDEHHVYIIRLRNDLVMSQHMMTRPYISIKYQFSCGTHTCLLTTSSWHSSSVLYTMANDDPWRPS
jgi:hypothetical protein